jgi:hypothetical protein
VVCRRASGCSVLRTLCPQHVTEPYVQALAVFF